MKLIRNLHLSTCTKTLVRLLPVISFIAGVSVLTAAKPNIVLIYVDDLPWYGTSVRMEAGNDESYTPWQRTPNIAKLASEGLTFSRAFAPAGVCGPSRACLQLGQSSVRARYTGNTGTGSGLTFADNGNVIKDEGAAVDPGNTSERLNEVISLSNIPRSQKTIAEAMKQDLGYATAFFGKWHLYAGGPLRNGYSKTGNDPLTPGVDGSMPNKGDTNNDPGKSPDPKDPKRMFTINNDAVKFMRNKVKNNKPFFVTLSHYAAHDQSQYLPETFAYYENLAAIDKAVKDSKQIKKAKGHAAMVEDLDTTIGILMDEIKALGIKNNTYVIFTADNGKEWETGKNGLRGAKWWLWDDALRVPMIVRGPGIPAGKRCNYNVVHYDFYPTFYDWGGGDLIDLPDYLDGVSLKTLMKNPTSKPSYSNRNLYFHYPHYRESTPHSAVISGHKKVLWFYERPNDLYYYNTKKDSYESHNLWPNESGARPEAMKVAFEMFAESVRSDSYIYPTDNDKWDGSGSRYNPDNDTPPRKVWTP